MSKIKILKYMEEEVEVWMKKNVGSDNRDDWSNYFRWCCHCGSYVHVDDYSGDRDICDGCDSD
ncbi:hypothetical protein [Paenibacillus sp. HB172176]|uniref:hypothetical protein n=1 Tax=Paenibacillus sp. HB172176 TaxID=2493690 RepID=UPI00143B616E|nr:hypothetical protein [Paenibacillus sp. HB172176]